MNKQKDYRPRQNRSWNDDDGRNYGRAPSPSFPSFPSVSSAPEEPATVKWYNADKGFGFVSLMDGRGDAFLHTNVLKASGFQSVLEGAELKVRVGQGQKGLQIDHVLSVTEGSGPPPRPRQQYGDRPHRNDRPRREVDLSAATEVTGVVKWYNAQKGFGFITPETGGKDIFVHATALERSGLGTLADGQSVRMTVVPGSKGPEVASICLS